jgi:glucokinase
MAVPEGDRGRVIATSAEACKLCAETMRIFTRAYGAEAGVAALKWLPTGGRSYSPFSPFSH